MKKRGYSLMMAAVMAASLLSGCSGSNSNAPQSTGAEESPTSQAAAQTSAQGAKESTNAADGAKEDAQGAGGDFSGTLKMYGPGLFADVGIDGTIDMITGVKKPGYQVVIDRWNELYPNVELIIEPIPWDNWKAALQTAAISGDVDILIHGASLGPVVEPLGPYVEKDSDYTTWTLDDLMEAAKATTGTDPKTGKETYGISPIKASDAFKNYIWSARAKNNEIFEWGDSIKNSKMNFVNDKTAEVLNYLTAFKDYTSPDYIEGLDLATAYTEDHNIAMVVVENPYNVYNTLKANGLEDQYMLAALPKIEDGPYKGVTSSHFGDWHMSICKNSNNKELAWEFLKFMTTDPVVQQWILDTYSIPTNIAANSTLGDYMSDDFADAIKYVIETCPNDFSCSENECYDSGNFGTFMNDLATVLNEMYQGNMDAQEAMEFVQKNVDDYLNTLQ